MTKKLNLFQYLMPLIGAMIIMITVSSCVTPKEIVYFQGAENLEKLVSDTNFEPKYQVDDILSIVVSSQSAEAVLPFNQNVGGTDGGPAPTAPGYLIGSDGTIIFPVIGAIKMAGLTRNEATKLLGDKLRTFVTDAVVSIRINNFKFIAMGEVNDPGTYTIPNERLTIIEAIGLAGDLTIKGKRDNIKLIRDLDGVKEFFEIDLTSKDIFNSPAYYLRQNDVIYVEPNISQIRTAGSNPNLLALILSLAGFGISVATFVSISN